VDGLVKLHRIDPLDIGLGDLGRPIGFLRRQVEQFVRQYDGVRFRDVPEFDELARRLAAAIPQEQNPGLVHGDFRIDNVVLDDCGQIIAVLDWEMCTYGDSLADLGLLQMYWGRSDDDLPPLAIGSSPVMELPGFPVWEEAIGRYREQVTVDLSQLDFYTVLAHFKLGVIVENMHKRYLAGGTVGKGFEFAGQLAVTLARRGLLIAERSSVLQLSG
jgi:aminoglycoside phosphotransferase (APT) family kinase protein